MAEKDSSAIGITSEQIGKVIDDLRRKGATFFTWEQLQGLIEKFGPETKISDVQNIVEAEKNKELKQ